MQYVSTIDDFHATFKPFSAVSLLDISTAVTCGMRDVGPSRSGGTDRGHPWGYGRQLEKWVAKEMVV